VICTGAEVPGVREERSEPGEGGLYNACSGRRLQATRKGELGPSWRQRRGKKGN